MENIGKSLKYTGPMHEISFSQADFTRHGVDDQSAVKFNGNNNWIADVSDGAAELLDEQFPKLFREATWDDVHEPDLTRVGSVAKPAYGRRASEAASVEKEDVDTAKASTSSSGRQKAVRTSQGSAGTGGTAGRGATAGRAT